MKTICSNCGKPFQKRNADFNRSNKRGSPHYCSLSCSASSRNKKYGKGNPKNLKPGNRLDKYSNFRWYLHNINKRKHKCYVTLLDLKNLWEKQEGVCPISGIKLKLRTLTNNKEKLQPYHASIDRIDSSKPYLLDNIRFIAVIANYAKNIWSDKEVLDFCKKVSDYND